MKLSGLGSLGVGVVKVQRDGKTVDLPVRVVSQLMMDSVLALYPVPVAPLGPDPARGSLAPYISREDDPEFVKAKILYNVRTDRVEAAVALDVEVDGMEGAGRIDGCKNAEALKAWCIGAEKAVAENLTAAEVRAVLVEVRRLSAAVVGDARKN